MKATGSQLKIHINKHCHKEEQGAHHPAITFGKSMTPVFVHHMLGWQYYLLLMSATWTREEDLFVMIILRPQQYKLPVSIFIRILYMQSWFSSVILILPPNRTSCWGLLSLSNLLNLWDYSCFYWEVIRSQLLCRYAMSLRKELNGCLSLTECWEKTGNNDYQIS